MPDRLAPQKKEDILTWIRGLTSITDDPGSLVAVAIDADQHMEADEESEAYTEAPSSDLDPTEVPAQSSNDAGTEIDLASSPSIDESSPSREAHEDFLTGLPEEIRRMILADPELSSQDLANIALTSRMLNSSVRSALDARRDITAIQAAKTEQHLIAAIDRIQNINSHSVREVLLVQAAERAGGLVNPEPSFQIIYDNAVGLQVSRRTSPLRALADIIPNLGEADRQLAIRRIEEASRDLAAEDQARLRETLNRSRATIATIATMSRAAGESPLNYARRLHAASPNLGIPRLSRLSGMLQRDLRRYPEFQEVPAQDQARLDVIAAATPRAAGESHLNYARRLHAANPNLGIPRLSRLSGMLQRDLRQYPEFQERSGVDTRRPVVALRSRDEAVGRSWNAGDRFQIPGPDGTPQYFQVTRNRHGGEEVHKGDFQPIVLGG